MPSHPLCNAGGMGLIAESMKRATPRSATTTGKAIMPLALLPLLNSDISKIATISHAKTEATHAGLRQKNLLQ